MLTNKTETTCQTNSVANIPTLSLSEERAKLISQKIKREIVSKREPKHQVSDIHKFREQLKSCDTNELTLDRNELRKTIDYFLSLKKECEYDNYCYLFLSDKYESLKIILQVLDKAYYNAYDQSHILSTIRKKPR